MPPAVFVAVPSVPPPPSTLPPYQPRLSSSLLNASTLSQLVAIPIPEEDEDSLDSSYADFAHAAGSSSQQVGRPVKGSSQGRGSTHSAASSAPRGSSQKARGSSHPAPGTSHQARGSTHRRTSGSSSRSVRDSPTAARVSSRTASVASSHKSGSSPNTAQGSRKATAGPSHAAGSAHSGSPSPRSDDDDDQSGLTGQSTGVQPQDFSPTLQIGTEADHTTADHSPDCSEQDERLDKAPAAQARRRRSLSDTDTSLNEVEQIRY
jgi:hypothetical protein